MKEKKRRSVIKAVTYRTSATVATFTLAYIFTGSLEIASQIGFLDFFVKFLIYYLNERIWSKTSWGYHSKTKNIKNSDHDYITESSRMAGVEH